MIEIAQMVAQLLLSAFVFVAALCRLAGMNIATHKPLWVLSYLGMALGAVTAVHEVAVAQASWSALLWGFSCAAYLWMSRLTWRDGVPRYLARGAA